MLLTVVLLNVVNMKLCPMLHLGGLLTTLPFGVHEFLLELKVAK